MTSQDVARPPARLELPGSGTGPAEVEVTYQPRSARMVRAVAALVVALLIAPVVFFIPPHFIWPLLAVIGGVYLARKYWTGEYYVHRFEGACPRCGTALDVKAGSRIRAREVLECYGCHRQPELVVDEPVA